VPGSLNQTRQIRAIPQKKTDRTLIDRLDQAEIKAILDAPNPHTATGICDRAMLHLCYAAALRVSELTGLSLDSFATPEMKTVQIAGKGRRLRELPLWNETREVLGLWMEVRPTVNCRTLFLNARGQPLGTDGFAYILKRHVQQAMKSTPTLRSKRTTPHVPRHSCAMAILHATRDVRKVSLWPGHEHLGQQRNICVRLQLKSQAR